MSRAFLAERFAQSVKTLGPPPATTFGRESTIGDRPLDRIDHCSGREGVGEDHDIDPRLEGSYGRLGEVGADQSRDGRDDVDRRGRRFGGRDHTTVMHGVRRIEELRSSDGQIAEDLELLRRALEA